MSNRQFFFAKDGFPSAINIESAFGVRVMSARGLHPAPPKEVITRDWADQHGVDVYIPASRKRRATEVTLTIYARDEYNRTAIQKYEDFCALIFDGTVDYWDTLQNRRATLVYNANKPSWYYFVGDHQIIFEITFLNPSGLTTSV